MPRKKINWAEVTCSICQKKGHGRKRCPEAVSTEANGGGMGNANGGFGSGSGEWEAPVNTGSAHSEWENTQAGDAYGAGAACGGGW
jgi:hypothetical protein